MQFSLQHLVLATAAVLVAVYALVYANVFWAVAAYTACIMLLLAAVVCAAAATGRPRFYWTGFATFGWGYWIVLHSPFLDMQPEPHNWQLHYEGPPVASRMAANWIYDNVLPRIHKPPQWDQSQWRTLNGSQFPNSTNFAQVFHSLCALTFALIGGAVGLLAHWRYRSGSSAA